MKPKLTCANPVNMPFLEAIAEACNAPPAEREKASARFAFHLGAASTVALLNGAKEEDVAGALERAFHLVQFARAYNG